MTKWHKLGFSIGLLMIIVGFLMYLPTWASHKLDAEHYAKTQGSPIWLEQNNQFLRSRYFMECKTMPPSDMDGPDTCVTEAFSIHPDRNWKQIAEENMKRGL